ncbi:DUF6227 family protein [Streptomyces tsukubensis]|uniref:Uncharacterized protein n=1 Tax=Streptomyces tsukubensis TaxID=83656 RepID=A0A1V4A4V2_9ACTN|nr:DUF6227 family protein [Streptomyces tsukubensis]OON76003.1 hypothetical protein B1H18_22020 [Streptomyces tsukubensis]QFR94095.1 hypothetical protein GBW32_14815 [Streptomyces tsukubensis]
MSVPYETPELPEKHVGHAEGLLERALNSFELPQETLTRLDSALAHDSALHSAHHSAGLHRETYRHTWLLTDGSALTLWELVYRSDLDGLAQHEVYADGEDATVAAARFPFGPADMAECDFEFDTEAPVQLPLGPEGPHREYVPDDSADHARRLLRRAENPDHPGKDMDQLLRAAFAHEITQAFTRPFAGGDASAPGYSLYEHAFLLLDGSEISLWEVEHTSTPDGRHMCEVYATREAAQQAMEGRSGLV